MDRLGGYLRLMRPINCLMMGFAVLVGGILATQHVSYVLWPNLAYGFITGFMLTAASMTINDYYDREIDAVNEPNRPIPSGLIQPKEALAFAFTLTVIGFVSAYSTNIFCFLTALVAWSLLLTYTTVGKRSGLPGNLLVSACVATPFVYGSYAVASAIEVNVLIFASMAFLANTGREITKGIVDVQGDRMKNIQTLAVRYGEKSAAVTAALFYLFAVLLSPIPWLLKIVSVWFIPLVTITDFGLAASSYMLVENYSRENARKVKKVILFWFIIGLLAFVFGAVW